MSRQLVPLGTGKRRVEFAIGFDPTPVYATVQGDGNIAVAAETIRNLMNMNYDIKR